MNLAVDVDDFQAPAWLDVVGADPLIAGLAGGKVDRQAAALADLDVACDGAQGKAQHHAPGP